MNVLSKESNVMAEKKLILLYIVDKMGVPTANSQIAELVIEKNYMDYFSFQMYISELVQSGFLIETKEKNTTKYVVSIEGERILGYFVQQIPDDVKHEINNYVIEHVNAPRKEFEMSANYFATVNNDFIVKCGVYEYDGSTLMEINVMVPTKEQAKQVCHNWKYHINYLYGKILSELVLERNV